MLFATTHAAPGPSMCNPATRFLKTYNGINVLVGISFTCVPLSQWMFIPHNYGTHFLSFPSPRFPDPLYNLQAPPTPPNTRPPRPPTPKTQLANDAITRHCRRLPVTQATDRKDRRAGSAHRKRRCPPACHISGAFKCLQEGLSADFPLLYAPVSA